MKERLQKILSAAGIASRRGAEEMIKAGRVTVNGETSSVGMSADPILDVIAVDGRNIHVASYRRYVVLNKPRGYVTTLKDDRGRPTVADLVKDTTVGLYPVGRLDMDSEGLLILTDDGEVANALMHPSREIPKVYTVFVQGENLSKSIAQLRRMDELEGERISRPQVMLIERKGNAAEFQITIHEGKNRQIRRMCKACGLGVSRLIRISEGAVLLGDLPSGKWRSMTKEEISYLQGLV